MRLILSLLLLVSTARAEVGIAYYAIQSNNFPCKEALRVYDNISLPSLSFLWSTFGSNNACLEEYLSRFRERRHILEIHFANGSCERLGRCRGGEINPRNSRQALRRIHEINTFVQKYTNPNTELILSTGLEDNYTEAEFKRLYRLLRREWGYDIVRNPAGNRVPRSAHVAYELHCLHCGKASVFSNDGTDIRFYDGERHLDRYIDASTLFAEIRQARERYDHIFLWWNAQGARDARNFTEPRARNIRIDPEAIRELNAFLKEEQR